MAQINIVGNINQTNNLFRLNEEDQNLIAFKSIDTDFKPGEDFIEYFILTPNNDILYNNYNYLGYKSSPQFKINPSGSLDNIEIDPVNDLKLLGYSSGEFKVQYNFVKNKISSFPGNDLFIKEISSDRTELRISSNTLDNNQIESLTNSLISEINNTSDYYKTYLLNFPGNIQYIVTNILLNNTTDSYEILLKLYNPLSEDIFVKSNVWVSDELINPYIFDINLDTFIEADPLPELRGPNFDIKIVNSNTLTNEYQTYDNFVSGLKNNSTSSYYHFISFSTSQSLNINVDYTSFENFVNFSSANNRISNFFDKIEDIQTNQSFILQYTPFVSTTSSLAQEIAIASSSIEQVISNFDGYEHYLYFGSSSYSWPKSTSTKPYTLYSYTSSNAIIWYNNMLTSASSYDDNNQNYLFNVLPQYIQNDTSNQQYVTFVNMIGHYFDNIWIYLKSVTDLFKNDNNLNDGISKDLVYEALKSLGFKVYNNNESESLLNYIVGNNSGSVDDFTNLSDEFLNNIPKQDLTAELWKRLYHNISLLYKSKGSTQGINYVKNIFGVTSSILDVREYGNEDYLTGYNDNINIINNSITGSELSPFISLEEKNVSSSFNSSYITDVSFSPQTQINSVISSSISSSYSTFNIENVLGNPQYDASSSYYELISTGSAILDSAFNYNFDYAGFIRLIQFFDNSLFKTIKDLSPVRNNVLTGVTIKPHQLERIKFKRNEPQVTQEEVYDAEYSAPTISEDKSYHWVLFDGNKSQFYTGEISGSVVDVNQYYEDNVNPYLGNISIWNSQHPISESIDINKFNHSDFNVLLNNVSQSVLSRIRRKYDAIFGTTGSIFAFAELQDSNLSLTSYNRSRYEGSKIISLLYNTYSSASGDYEGDISFGKTAAIDHNVRKMAIFTQIESSSFLPGRNNISLKYLVDEFGGLTELNQSNKHWCEVQRTFIANETSSISLFDNKKYSNQKTTDGEKLIFDSGYTYNPILYFGTGSLTLAFQSVIRGSSYTARAINGLSTSSYISGSTNNGYPLSSSAVSKLFDQVIEGSTYFSGGTSTSLPVYTIQETGIHRVSASFNFSLTLPTIPTSSATWSFQLIKSSSAGYTILEENMQYFAAGDPATSILSFSYYAGGQFTFELSNAINSTNAVISGASVDGYADGVCGGASIENDGIISAITINAGTTSATGGGLSPMDSSVGSYRRTNFIIVNGLTKTNGETLTIGGTTVTISISNSCDIYAY